MAVLNYFYSPFGSAGNVQRCLSCCQLSPLFQHAIHRINATQLGAACANIAYNERYKLPHTSLDDGQEESLPHHPSCQRPTLSEDVLLFMPLGPLLLYRAC